MNITDLTRLLQSESTRLRANGAPSDADEVENLCNRLSLVGNWTLTELTRRLATVAKQPRRPPSKSPQSQRANPMIDRDKVEQALRRIAYLRDNISSDSVDYELIDETMADVEKGLSKPEALAVAERTGTVITSKSRKEVVAEIRRMLRGLKKSYERNSGRERSIETVPALAQ